MRAWMLPAGSDGFDKLYLEELPDPAPGRRNAGAFARAPAAPGGSGVYPEALR